MEKTVSLKEQDLDLNRDKPVHIFRKYFTQNDEVLLHYHDSLEINFSFKINGSVTIGNSSLDLSSHEIIVFSPGRLHSYHIQKSSGYMIVAHISLVDLDHYLRLENLFPSLQFNPKNLPLIAPEYDKLIPLLTRLEEENTAIALLPTILKVFEVIGGIDYDPTPLEGMKDNLIKKVINFTEENYSNNVTLGTVSSHFGYTRSYFCRLFKKRTSFRYWDYLKHVRIEHAKEMLMQGMRVAQVGYACGFDDLSYFIKVFKLHVGVTPGKFIKLNLLGLK
jgi:AraC-like DNA-binding protein